MTPCKRTSRYRFRIEGPPCAFVRPVLSLLLATEIVGVHPNHVDCCLELCSGAGRSMALLFLSLVQGVLYSVLSDPTRLTDLTAGLVLVDLE